MSTFRIAAVLGFLWACRTPSVAPPSLRASVAVTSTPRDGGAPASGDAGAPANPNVAHLPEPLPPSDDVRARFDADGAAWSAPSGGWALVHDSEGDTEVRVLSRAALACLRGKGRLQLRLTVTPHPKGASDVHVDEREGPEGVPSCVVEVLRREPRWQREDPFTVDVVIIVR